MKLPFSLNLRKASLAFLVPVLGWLSALSCNAHQTTDSLPLLNVCMESAHKTLSPAGSSDVLDSLSGSFEGAVIMPGTGLALMKELPAVN